MKKRTIIFLSIVFVLALSACGQKDSSIATGETNVKEKKGNTTARNRRVLIAYFTVPEDVKTSDYDVIARASIVIKNSEKMGNTEYVARLIQETIGGDLFRIETKETYPLEHEILVNQAARGTR